MKLVKVTITNYRSIIKAYNLDLSNLTVLVGPNNEGKSNILTAINLALDILSNWNKKSRMMYRTSKIFYLRDEKIDYKWNRDFPINLQSTKQDGRSTITLEIELSDKELSEFKRKTDINLNTNLKIKMGFGINDVTYDILMKGKAKRSLNSKRNEISDFIQNKLVYQYISAIRPSSYAENIIERVLDIELNKLESDPKYKEAMEVIESIKQPIIDDLSNKIKDTIKNFIPSVNNIKILSRDRYRRYSRRQYNILLDDGTETELNMKGDGIVSLSSISLVQHFNNELSNDKNLIFAIEEPESHLHPESITAIKKVLFSIAENSQVIISTHSPILVDRLNINNNIIVNTGKAEKSKTIKQIRNALGIRFSDNLSNAQLSLLLEGDTDKKMLLKILVSESELIRQAIEKGMMIIDGIGGANKLGYYIQFYKQNLTNIHVFFDNDEDGRRNIDNSLDKQLLTDNEYNLTNCNGMANSEIEDLVDMDAYKDIIYKEFTIDLNTRIFRNNKNKW